MGVRAHDARGGCSGGEGVTRAYTMVQTIVIYGVFGCLYIYIYL